MPSIYATTIARIWGTANAWSLSRFAGPSQPNEERTVELEIQGDERNGYVLIVSPSGHFTADSWHPTKQDALDSAKDLFDVAQDTWSCSRPGR